MISFYQSLVHERAGTSIICQADTFCGLAVFSWPQSNVKKEKKKSAVSLLTVNPLIPFIPTCEWLRCSCSWGHFPTADLNGCDGMSHTLPKEIRGTMNAWQCRASPQLCHQTTSVNSKAEIGDVTLMRLSSPDPDGGLLFWSKHIFESVAFIFSRWLRTKELAAPTAQCTRSRNHEGPFEETQKHEEYISNCYCYRNKQV